MADSPEAAWSAYRDALDDVFRGGTRDSLGLLAEAEPGELSDDALDSLVERSGELHDAIAPRAREPGDVAELAALQLQAGAALDFDAANRLAAMAASADEDLEEVAPRTAGGFLTADDLAQLGQILDTPPDRARSVLDGASDAFLLSSGAAVPSPADADALKKVVDAAIDSIVADSTGLAGKTVSGLLQLPADKLADAIEQPIKTIFDLIGEKAGRILSRAAKLVRRGVEKLLSLFGKHADAVRKLVGTWVDGLDQDKIAALFARLFPVQRIKDSLHDEIDQNATGHADGCAAAAAQVAKLGGRLHNQLEILGKVVWVLRKTQGWLMNVSPPWGLVGVTAAYVVGTGYAIDSGQDYLDWGQSRLLDLVDGVKHAVEANLE
jgi:hypothetical protein